MGIASPPTLPTHGSSPWDSTLDPYIQWAGGALIVGSGAPEGVVVATVGWMYRRLDGGPGITWYVKEAGTGTSVGWAAK